MSTWHTQSTYDWVTTPSHTTHTKSHKHLERTRLPEGWVVGGERGAATYIDDGWTHRRLVNRQIDGDHFAVLGGDAQRHGFTHHITHPLL